MSYGSPDRRRSVRLRPHGERAREWTPGAITAVACALVFLVTNGVEVPPDQGQLYAAMIALARRELDKPGLAALLRRQFPRA